jgi:hypothetical protein
LLLSASAWAAPPAAQAPSPPAASPASAEAEASSANPESAEVAADAAFRRGNELADRNELEGALLEFESAYALSPAYQVLYNIGVVSYRLDRWASARRAFEQYRQLGGPQLSPERLSQVSGLIAELSGRTATLRLLLNVTGAEVHIDGKAVKSNEMTGLILDPGEHVVRVSKPGFKPLEQVLRATHGESVQVVLPLAPLHADAARLPPESPFAGAPEARVETLPIEDGGVTLWVPWTITGVLAAGWMTTAGLAIKARHDRDIIERPGTPAPQIDDARRLHQTLAIVSDVLLASTLVSAGVSAYVTWWPRPDPNVSGGSPGLRVAADGLTLEVVGQF